LIMGMGILGSALAGLVAGTGAGMVANANAQEATEFAKMKEDLLTKREVLMQELRQKGSEKIIQMTQDFERPYKDASMNNDAERLETEKGRLVEEQIRTTQSQQSVDQQGDYYTGMLKNNADKNAMQSEINHLRSAAAFAKLTSGGKPADDEMRKKAIGAYWDVVKEIEKDPTIKDKTAAVASLDGRMNAIHGLPETGEAGKIGEDYGVKTWRGFKKVGKTPDSLKALGFEPDGATKTPAAKAAAAAAAKPPSVPLYMRALPTGQLKPGKELPTPTVPSSAGIIFDATDPDEELREANPSGV
jgi:hypothetical protein